MILELKKIKDFEIDHIKVTNLFIRLLFLIALALRIGYSFYGQQLDQEVWSDMGGYVHTAERVLNNDWTDYHFFQSIGYSLIIAFFKFFTLSWGKFLSFTQALASFGALVLMFEIARETLGKKVAVLSLLLGTFHLPWIYFIGYALPETYFTFFLALGGWCALKIVKEERTLFYSLGWGLSFLFAFWLKGTHVFWAPIFLIGLVIHKKRKGILPALIISLVFAAGISLHGLLAKEKIGKFQVSSSAGGINFIEGKCPSKKNKDSAGYEWLSPLFYQLNQFEAKTWERPFTDSKYFMQEGLKCIKENPFSLVQSLESIPYLFYGNTTWPINQKPERLAIRVYEVFLALFFIIGLSSYVRFLFLRPVNWSELLVLVPPVLGLFLCVYLFKSEMRFRLPFDIYLIPLSFYGWMQFVNIRSELYAIRK